MENNMNSYGFDLNLYLLLSLVKENRKLLEDTVLNKRMPSTVMRDITESFYNGFYDRNDMKKSSDFKDNYGRLNSLNDAYLYYYLSQYYYLMNNWVINDTTDDYRRYKFVGHDIAAKLKADYVTHFNKTPFNFVRYYFDKNRNKKGHFTSLNGISSLSLTTDFEQILNYLRTNKLSSVNLNDLKNVQYKNLKELLANLGIAKSFNLISDSIWEGFYDHRFFEIKNLFGKIGKTALNQKLDASLLSYRISMLEVIINLLREKSIKNIDLLLIFSKEIGRIAKLKFYEEKKNYPFNYLENYYFGSDQISLFNDERRKR